MATSQVQLVMSPHVNGMSRLFGGQLISWIDIVGAIEAKRWAKQNVTLLTVDNLTFLKPAYMDDTVFLEATLTWTGRTSMEVRVLTYIEKLNGEKVLANKAYMVYVALNEEDIPYPIPVFTPTSYEEKAEWNAACERKQVRLKNKEKK